MRQFRLVHVGVAAAMAAATVSAIGLVQTAGAAGSGAASVLVPITPCRLIDTRSGGDNVGARSAPIGSGEAATFQVTGTNGNCIIPAAATGIATNATAVNPTSASYITIYPADASPRPTASNLNFVADAAPTPNQVTTGLSTQGAIGIYNLAGNVDVIVDIVGYYIASAGGGAQGPTGPQGPQGVPGPACPSTGCTLLIGAFNVEGYFKSAVTYNVHGCVYGTSLRLPVDLPAGAIITKVTVRYVDDATSPNFFYGFRLERIDTGAQSTTFASNELTSTNGQRAGDATLIEPVTPVAADATYYISATAKDGNLSVSLTFCGATITYRF